MVKNIFATILILFAMSTGITFASMPEKPQDRMIDAAVFDNSQTLSKNEIQALTQKIQTVQQKHKVKIGVEFLKTIRNANISSAAHELLNRHYGDGQNGGIIFLVVMDNRNWYVATDSKMEYRIPNANDIGNKLLPNLREGDYYGACNAYIDAVDKSLTYYEQNGAAYDSSDEFNVMAAMAAVVLGIFFGVMVRSWLIGSMSNVHHEISAKDYLKRETVKFTKTRDTYLYTNTERRPKPSSSSRGNGNGGGGSSGGGGGAGGSF